MYWAKNGDFETHENLLSIIYNGAIAAGKVYAQKEKTGILAESYFIKLKKYNVCFEVNLFLQCVLEKVLYPKYSRDYLATWDKKVENDKILLPVYPTSSCKKEQNADQNHQIAFDFMEAFIKALQKESLKQVDSYNQAKIKAHKEVIKA